MKRRFLSVATPVLILLGAISAPRAFGVEVSATAVEELRLSSATAHSVLLDWNAPTWGASNVSDYHVEYRRASESSWTPFVDEVSTETQVNVTDLTPGYAYSFRVAPVIAGVSQLARTLGINQVAIGMSHGCSLDQSGEVSCWGDNTFGQLGNADLSIANSSVPVQVAGVTATAIAAGRDHTCALVIDGTIICWGSNTNGQLGTGDTSYQFSATPRQTLGIATATSVAAGAMHSCAVVDSGSIKCWGAGAKYRLGLAASYGQNDVSTPTLVAGLVGAAVTQVAAGTSQSCALLSNGGLKCWGDNASGQLGSGTTSAATATPRSVSGIDGSAGVAIQLSMGSQHACAVLSDGTARCWGNGGSGRLGNGTTANSASPVFVKMAGATLGGIRSLSAGAESSCAVINSGEVVCWGNNTTGQLGNGEWTSQSQAVSTGMTNAVAVAADLGSNVAGNGHNCALLADASIRCWGAGSNFVLGNEQSVSSAVPVLASAGVATLVPLAGAPDAPAWLSPVVGIGSLELRWTTPSNNGSAVTSINVSHSGGSLDGVVACVPAAGDTSCIVSNLSSTVTHRFAISATNTLGASAAVVSEAYATQTSGLTYRWSWDNSSGNMLVTGCLEACDNLIVPSSIENIPVYGIAPRAFAANPVVNVTFPNSVTSIASDAFGAKRLPLANLVSFKARLSGSAVVGSALTAVGSNWPVSASRQFVWLRDGLVIPGASRSRYVLTSEDFGKSISAVVTLSKNSFITTSLMSEEVVVGAGVMPVTSAPGLVGTFRVGRTVTAKVGKWPLNTGFTYRWLVGGVVDGSSVGSSYTIGPDALGKTISVEVIGTKFGYVEALRSSKSFTVLPGIQSPIVGLTIIGVPKVGQPLTASLSGAGYQYQWLRNGVPIAGATDVTYVQTSTDVGRRVSLRITRSEFGYVDAAVGFKGSVVRL